jgi:hypothetical protein
VKPILCLLLFTATSSAADSDCCDDPKLGCCDPPSVSRFHSQEKRDYPDSLVERPLILPPLMVQVGSTLGLTNLSGSYFASDQAGVTLALGADLGLGHGLQLGLYAATPLSTNAMLDSFVASLQIKLTRYLNARIDLGAKEIDGFWGPNSTNGAYSIAGFVFGVGLPLKVKLGRRFALVSGSTSALGFGPQPMVLLDGFSHFSYFGSSVVSSSDLLTVWASSTFVAGAFTLPVGVVFQPLSKLSFGLRTGYRLGFTRDASGNSNTSHAVPLGFDVAFTMRSLDVGFNATLLGPLSDPYASQVGWAEAQQYDFHIRGRF